MCAFEHIAMIFKKMFGKPWNLFPLFEIEQIYVYFSFRDVSRPIVIFFSASIFFTFNLLLV